jgi:methyl-accepting chemotaxis protein
VIDTLNRSRPPRESQQDLSLYCEEGGADLRVRADQPISAAIEAFRCNARLRTLPVVDADDRPISAIFEQDVRAILYNPYGHALLNNPSFNRASIEHSRACPIADCATPLPELLETYSRSDGSEGVILTRQGRLFGLITNRTLIRLAADREAEIARARMLRLERVAAAGDRFIADISRLAEVLGRVAAGIEETAAATASQAGLYRQRASAVAAAAAQTTGGMLDLAQRGAGLASTVDRVRGDTVVARDAAHQAVALSEASLQRGQALSEVATAIDATLATVQTISSQAKLLAINAAIEAARMGRDGSGFAVVARELKQFAANTRKAAGDITDRIAGIHQTSAEVIEGQRAIGGVVRTIDDMARSIDEAIGAQAATARLLAENVDQALQAKTDINANVTEISQMVSCAAEGSDAMRTMAGDLAAETMRLRDRVGAFVAELRAAD